MNVEALMYKFRRGESDVYRVRYLPGEYRDGIFSAPIESKKRIFASIQALTERTPGATPEMLLRSSSFLVCYTATELFEADVDKRRRADIVEFEGVKYSVVSVAANRHLGLSHFQVILKRETA